ncbi:uncharacterized protein K460DRAFT_364695 [Cucurbitaria berberidis CBS 394.84]|uniref:F-box domain-containing protein n=1 Tax=Cucurbitaria berberidis CBS 394.84 TaxID=1168544 RepID=A0A9P4GLS2_9PLEO|nr:uncharacterized protein K460DRAFT_364695 [Cucurbitaria berberidis CBS 394.84]KAF1848703.1 hypothetical protein K460DRAFT_364695 [Cucurbitaria berberidis CBS 394.84]
MAPAGRKRKFATSSGVAGRLDSETVDTVDVETPLAKLLKQQDVSTFRTPNNPQATLEGLPAELRLQIYDYLSESTILHVHRHVNRKTKRCRYTWTPCREPNPSSPLLCANPKWSGMCAEQDRCTYKVLAPPEPRGLWALAASNKFIRNEAQELFMGRSVLSIHPNDLRPFLRYMKNNAPGQLSHLRRITIAGPDYLFSQSDIELLPELIPNLEAVGYQCQLSSSRWWSAWAQYDKLNLWRGLPMVEWMRSLDSSTTIALEAMSMWEDKQMTVRMLRQGEQEKGKKFGGCWKDADVKVKIDEPDELVAPKRDARWRIFWRNMET